METFKTNFNSSTIPYKLKVYFDFASSINDELLLRNIYFSVSSSALENYKDWYRKQIN
jgi:hypothetical protein